MKECEACKSPVLDYDFCFLCRYKMREGKELGKPANQNTKFMGDDQREDILQRKGKMRHKNMEEE